MVVSGAGVAVTGASVCTVTGTTVVKCENYNVKSDK